MLTYMRAMIFLNMYSRYIIDIICMLRSIA